MAKTKDTFALDLHGQRFGRWVVLRKQEERGPHGEVSWLCRCDCGTERAVKATSLRNGRSPSCGCLSRERFTKHGMEGTPTYNAWAHMLARCRNPKTQLYECWGGRGIKVCKEWESFEAFYADMGEKPKGKSLDRIDNDGNYEPGNCRWASIKQQIRNRRKTPMVEYQGRKLSVAELAEMHGIKRKLVLERLKRGLSITDALSCDRHGRWGRTRSKVK